MLVVKERRKRRTNDAVFAAVISVFVIVADVIVIVAGDGDSRVGLVPFSIRLCSTSSSPPLRQMSFNGSG